jgi:eukaryotic-like serine/threonine-protein kinase
LIETLAHFRIVKKIGAGGMGEVYLAEDTRLRRRVALKVLPPDLAQHRDRLSRFEQEACAASGLSHPNILVVYEIGEDAGRHYIATEYVDGHTLRRRMAGGGLSPAEALDAAIQVAAALVAAHEAGIVHRDIKPENIMIRADGYVKVVDFGLAKLSAAEAASEIDDQALTRTDTEPGKVMGTIEYMSPEQARGLPVDARTDVYSLGAVLYEALSGQPPFQGATRSDVLAALLSTDAPPLPRPVEQASGELPWVVGKMLRKDRDERYQSAREVLADLKRARQALDRPAPVPRLSPASEAASPPRSPRLRRVGVALAGALLAVAAYTAWTSRSSRSWRPTPVVVGEQKLGGLFRLDTSTGEWQSYLPGVSAYHLDFSPDGQWITYVDYPEATLCRSRPDGTGRTQLTMPPLRAATPRWSPDGTRIVFVAALPGKPWKLHVVSPERSPARPLTTLDREERTPGWSPDGRRIVFGVPDGEGDDRLIRILDLTTQREIAVPGSQDKYSPRWSPDGRQLLAITYSNGALVVGEMRTGNWRDLGATGVSWPQWSRDGKHIYFQTLNADSVSRVRVADARVEPWAAVKGVQRVRIEPFGAWLGLAPDDSVLVMGKSGDSSGGTAEAEAVKEHNAAPPAW